MVVHRSSIGIFGESLNHLVILGLMVKYLPHFLSAVSFV